MPAARTVNRSNTNVEEPQARSRIDEVGAASLPSGSVPAMSKKTKKRKLKARRNKANHGKRPRVNR
jgi:hypothetical protein